MSVCCAASTPNVYGFGFGGNEPLESVDPSTDGVATCSPPPLTDLNDTPEPDGTGEAVMPRPKTPVCGPADPCCGWPCDGIWCRMRREDLRVSWKMCCTRHLWVEVAEGTMKNLFFGGYETRRVSEDCSAGMLRS
ncbi:hypothetical protein M404DRAFT_504185 [Pisolithus tinctorius Marx 270]|uniref:Uncharacterized protein n=1 Tax=Pisolithus tinctorius Marx 270 TaxID=870435 RepID=A0A0C3PDE0_PISTI|nr:hypothetical protein M404DRAFT_504185 [Pisolithus tinctorius Marx 270]